MAVGVPDVSGDLCLCEAGLEPGPRIEPAFIPSRGNTGSDGLWSGCFNDWIAATASEFRWPVRADPFFVFVSSIVRRSKCTCDHVLEYCSLSLIPV